MMLWSGDGDGPHPAGGVLEGIVSQRLCKTSCAYCGTRDLLQMQVLSPSEQKLGALGLTPAAGKPQSCQKCQVFSSNQGYQWPLFTGFAALQISFLVLAEFCAVCRN